MKKTAVALLMIVATAFCAKAQDRFDALTFSENDYQGTARTMAMGNAFTALGGDLGSININPAGSAVAGYSQVTLTPGVSISVNSASGTSSNYFNNTYKTNYPRFALPNVGINFNFKTNRSYGLKNWSLGIIVNSTGDYTDDVYARGNNSTSTFAGSIASLATGYYAGNLVYNSYYNTGIPWDCILGYQSGLIDYIDYGEDDPDTGYYYMGVTENYKNGQFVPGGNLDQVYRKRTRGYKYDYVINWGGNINDIVYLGLSLGLTSIDYDTEYYIRETPGSGTDYSAFETQFSRLRYTNHYSASGVGVYGKFGVIVTPGLGLRFGAAIQTPTSTTIRETWWSSCSVSALDSNYYTGDAQTPKGEYRYRLTNPWRFNVGLAYTLGKFGVVSADYEYVPYGTMRFKEIGSIDNYAFEDTNNDIKTYMGASHMLRVGLEVKPISLFAIRLGYGLTTSPEKYLNTSGQLEKVSADKHSFSFGVGYSSRKSFFMDAAVKATKYPTSYIYPYDYYAYDENGDFGIDYSVDTPEIKSRSWLFNVVLTVGFRF
ncbi:MAG: hypothetical protein LUD72_11080 [Bacteroidales bacterium]|nr:hypothetical protein [Bacteroidales bacterium]